MKSLNIKPSWISFCLCWLCLFLVTACGQKGPLFLPEPAPPPRQAETRDADATAKPAPQAATDPATEPAETDDDESP